MIDPINIQLRHRTGSVPYGRPRNAPSHPHRLVDAARTTWKGDFSRQAVVRGMGRIRTFAFRNNWRADAVHLMRDDQMVRGCSGRHPAKNKHA